MAARIQALAQQVVEEYDGDAARLWNEAETGKELLRRLQALPGFGKQKAQIFVALLAKQLDVRPRAGRRPRATTRWRGYRSVADVVDADSLLKVRAFKQQKKAAAKAASA